MPRRYAYLYRGSLGALALSIPTIAYASPVDRLHCIAADMALTRGFEAMEGTKFPAADGSQYSLGKSERSVSYTLTPSETKQVTPLVDKLAPGAIEYVDLWLVGPGSTGRSKEKVMTGAAQAFITSYQECLAAYGPGMTP